MPSNPSDLRATGDLMQSALSRLAEFVGQLDRLQVTSTPYEVRMALAEAHDAIEAWTALRRQDAASGCHARRSDGDPCCTHRAADGAWW